MDISVDVIIETKLKSKFDSIRNSAITYVLEKCSDTQIKQIITRLTKQVAQNDLRQYAIGTLLQCITSPIFNSRLQSWKDELLSMLQSIVGSSQSPTVQREVILLIQHMFWISRKHFPSSSSLSVSVTSEENPNLALYKVSPNSLDLILECIDDVCNILGDSNDETKPIQSKWIDMNIQLFMLVLTNPEESHAHSLLSNLLRGWFDLNILSESIFEMITCVLKTNPALPDRTERTLLLILADKVTHDNDPIDSDSFALLCLSLAVNAVFRDAPSPWHRIRTLLEYANKHRQSDTTGTLYIFCICCISAAVKTSQTKIQADSKSSLLCLGYTTSDWDIRDTLRLKASIPCSVIRCFLYPALNSIEQNHARYKGWADTLCEAQDTQFDKESVVSKVREDCTELMMVYSGTFSLVLSALVDVLDQRLDLSCTFAYPLLYSSFLTQKRSSLSDHDIAYMNSSVKNLPPHSILSCLHVLEFTLGWCKTSQLVEILYRDHLPVYLTFDDPFLTRKVMNIVSTCLQSGTVLHSTPLEKLGLETLFKIWEQNSRVWSKISSFLKVWMHRVNSYLRGGLKLSPEQEHYNLETDRTVLQFLLKVISARETGLWKDVVPVIATVLFQQCVGPPTMELALRCMNELVSLRVVSIESVWSQGLRRVQETYTPMSVGIHTELSRFYGFVGSHLGDSEADLPFVNTILEKYLMPCLISETPQIRDAAHKALSFFPRELINFSPDSLKETCQKLALSGSNGAYSLLSSWIQAELEDMPRPVLKGLASGAGVSRSAWLNNQQTSESSHQDRLMNYALDLCRNRDNVRLSSALREAYSVFLMNQAYLYYTSSFPNYDDALNHLKSFLEYLLKDIKLPVSIIHVLDMFDSLKHLWSGFIHAFESNIALDAGYLTGLEELISDVYQAAVDPSVHQMCILAKTALLSCAVEMSVHDVMNHVQLDLTEHLKRLLSGKLNEMAFSTTAFAFSLLTHILKDANYDTILNAFIIINEAHCDFRDNRALFQISLFLLYEHASGSEGTSNIMNDALLRIPRDSTFFMSLFFAERFVESNALLRIGQFEDSLDSLISEVKPPLDSKGDGIVGILVKLYFAVGKQSSMWSEVLDKINIIALESLKRGPFDKYTLLAFTILHSSIAKYGDTDTIQSHIHKITDIDPSLSVSQKSRVLQSAKCLLGYGTIADRISQAVDMEVVTKAAFDAAQIIQNSSDASFLKAGLGVFSGLLSYVTGNVALTTSTDRDPIDLRRLSPDTSVIRILWDLTVENLQKNRAESVHVFLNCVEHLDLTFPRLDFGKLIEATRQIAIERHDVSPLERLFIFASKQITLARNTSLLQFFISEMRSSSHDDQGHVPFSRCVSPHGVGVIPKLIVSGTTLTTSQAIGMIRSLLFTNRPDLSCHVSLLSNLLSAIHEIEKEQLPTDLSKGLTHLIQEFVKTCHANVTTLEEKMLLSFAVQYLGDSNQSLRDVAIQNQRDIWFHLLLLFETHATVPPSTVLGEFIEQCLSCILEKMSESDTLISLGEALVFAVQQKNTQIQDADRWRLLITLLDIAVFHDDQVLLLWIDLICPILPSLFGTHEKTSSTGSLLHSDDVKHDHHHSYASGIHILLTALKKENRDSDMLRQIQKRISHLLASLQKTSPSQERAWIFAVTSFGRIDNACRAFPS